MSENEKAMAAKPEELESLTIDCDRFRDELIKVKASMTSITALCGYDGHIVYTDELLEVISMGLFEATQYFDELLAAMDRKGKKTIIC